VNNVFSWSVTEKRILVHKNNLMEAQKDLKIPELEKAAFILKSIAHPSRLAIINILSQQEWLAVSEISNELEIEQSLTSHHLNIMKMKGVLESKREGKNIKYKLKLTEVKEVISCIEHCDLSRF